MGIQPRSARSRISKAVGLTFGCPYAPVWFRLLETIAHLFVANKRSVVCNQGHHASQIVRVSGVAAHAILLAVRQF